MYNNATFEGVRIVDDNKSPQLIIVLSLDPQKYGNESAMNRVAAVKAQSMASRFFNGSEISDDIIIKTTESGGASSTEIIETIREHSAGDVKALELLTSFEAENGRTIFIFSTPSKQNDKK